jgi:hypothetical protein
MKTFVIVTTVLVALACAIPAHHRQKIDCESKRCSAGHKAQQLPYVGCLCVEEPRP